MFQCRANPLICPNEIRSPPPISTKKPPRSQLHSSSTYFQPPAMPSPGNIRRRRRRGSSSDTSTFFPFPSAAAVESPSPQPDDQRKGTDLQTLFRRFWKVAGPYWFSDDKVQARLELAAVFALTLGTTGISVGFSFLGRDFYNALASRDTVIVTGAISHTLSSLRAPFAKR